MKERLGLEFSGSLGNGLHETSAISFAHESSQPVMERTGKRDILNGSKTYSG
jgi:hypothetical protein